MLVYSKYPLLSELICSFPSIEATSHVSHEAEDDELAQGEVGNDHDPVTTSQSGRVGPA